MDPSKTSELYMLFYDKLPQHRHPSRAGEVLNMTRLSTDLGVSKQKIWLWLKENRLPATRLMQVIDLSGSRFKMEDLAPYITTKKRYPKE